MTDLENQKPGKILWAIANQLHGAINADGFRDDILSFLFLRCPIGETSAITQNLRRGDLWSPATLGTQQWIETESRATTGRPYKILWAIADQLRDAMNADDFRDYMLSFLFLRYPVGETPSHQLICSHCIEWIKLEDQNRSSP